MSHRAGKMTIEIDSDVNIWKCDRCGDERPVRKDEQNFYGSPPIGWIRLHRVDTDPALDNSNDFCTDACASDWLLSYAAKTTVMA